MRMAKNPELREKLAGLRVLVVEDEFLAAKSLETSLRTMGCHVVGPASTVEEAIDLIKRESIDAAILDINLSPGTCEPVARALRYRSRPFVFITGYSNINVLPDDLRGHRILTKPADRMTLASAVHQLARDAKK
jgi:DNA-binding LytR/AlgR family response regulator